MIQRRHTDRLWTLLDAAFVAEVSVDVKSFDPEAKVPARADRRYELLEYVSRRHLNRLLEAEATSALKISGMFKGAAYEIRDGLKFEVETEAEFHRRVGDKIDALLASPDVEDEIKKAFRRDLKGDAERKRESRYRKKLQAAGDGMDREGSPLSMIPATRSTPGEERQTRAELFEVLGTYFKRRGLSKEDELIALGLMSEKTQEEIAADIRAWSKAECEKAEQEERTVDPAIAKCRRRNKSTISRRIKELDELFGGDLSRVH